MKSKTVPIDLSRRLALQRLGLAVGAAYVAPVIMSLSDARASSGGGSGGGGGGSGGGGGGGMGGAGGGSSSMPSEPSTSMMSSPSSSDSADAGGSGGTTLRKTASAVAKVPGKVFNGVKGLFSR